jgi:hypothetical protein
MKFKCWMIGYREECATDIDDALDAEDAAQLACEKWESGGTFAGDPHPNPIEVMVRDENDVLLLVEVEPQYDVSFWAARSRSVTP